MLRLSHLTVLLVCLGAFVQVQAGINAATSCYIAARTAIRVACGAQTSDLIASAKIDLAGSAYVDGQVYAPNVVLGECSEITGDVQSFSLPKYDEDVFVHGMTTRFATIDFQEVDPTPSLVFPVFPQIVSWDLVLTGVATAPPSNTEWSLMRFKKADRKSVV